MILSEQALFYELILLRRDQGAGLHTIALLPAVALLTD